MPSAPPLEKSQMASCCSLPAGFVKLLPKGPEKVPLVAVVRTMTPEVIGVPFSSSSTPAEMLMDFCQSTYEAAVIAGNWDRANLERPATIVNKTKTGT